MLLPPVYLLYLAHFTNNVASGIGFLAYDARKIILQAPNAEVRDRKKA
jgi:hypothetical protein